MNILNSIGHMFNSLSGDTLLGKIGIALSSLIIAYFAPIVGLLTACFACTIVDMLYGIKVAHKLGKKITSKKNWKGTLIKIKDEFTIILLSHLLEFTVFGSEVPFLLTGGATVLICLTEIWSIIENLNTLDPTGPWKILGAFLKKKGEDYTGINIELNEYGDIKSAKLVKDS